MTIGIDEVGRGSLAGPVMVCALALPKLALKTKSHKLKAPLRDSKKLTARQREEWYAWIIHNSQIKYTIARCSPKTIDRINITKAANRAAHRAYQNLQAASYKRQAHVIVDAGLKLPNHIAHRTMVQADEKIPAVACASIVAKVTRDRYMARQHKKYPCYQFIQHKGYGTPAHSEALKRHGPCPLHRKSFITKILNPQF